MPKAVNGKMTTNPRIDKLINYFIQLRTQRDEMRERHKQEEAPTLHGMEVVSGELIKILDGAGVESARTKSGTASLSTHDSASCSDPNLFMEYVREHDAYELMNRHPNPTACKEFAKEHGKLPPGVKLNIKRTVRVNAPGKELAE
jgi:hypothetical protein